MTIGVTSITSNRLVALVVLCSVICGIPAQADTYDPHPMAISMFNIVDPGSQNLSWSFIIHGTTQISSEGLQDLIGPKGSYVLRIRTIQAFVHTTGVPFPQDYARVAMAQCSDSGSIAGFGAGQLVVSGGDHGTVTYNPGLVAALGERMMLCTSSVIQSTVPAVVQVHGYLEKK